MVGLEATKNKAWKRAQAKFQEIIAGEKNRSHSDAKWFWKKTTANSGSKEQI